MGATESRLNSSNIASLAVNLLAACMVMLGTFFAVGSAVGNLVFQHFGMGPTIRWGLGTTTICAWGAGLATGVASAFALRPLFRRFGNAAAISGLLAIPLVMFPIFFPFWNSLIVGALGGAFSIFLVTRCTNRRSKLRHFKPPAPPADPPTDSN